MESIYFILKEAVKYGHSAKNEGWHIRPVYHRYSSRKEAEQFHNLRNCDYQIKRNGHVWKEVSNANVDKFGHKYVKNN